MTDNAKELRALADYLRHQNEYHSNSICAADPIINNHIADLKRWEDLTRLSARQQASVESLRQWLNEQPYKSSTLAERLLAKYDIFEKVEG